MEGRRDDGRWDGCPITDERAKLLHDAVVHLEEPFGVEKVQHALQLYSTHC